MNKNFKNYAYMSFALALATTMASCSDDDNKVEIQETDAAYVGKEVVILMANISLPCPLSLRKKFCRIEK